MADLYGVASGVQASDENIRQNIHTGILAQKTLGDIAMQPAELALKQAQVLNTGALTRFHTAEAAKLESAARDITRMRDLQEKAAEQGAIDKARVIEGRDLTIADRPEGGFTAPRSAAEPIERFIQYAQGQKAPLDMLLPYIKQAEDTRHKEAQTLSATAEAAVRQATQVKATAERLGTVAQAALQGPEAYAQIRALGLLPPGLPLSFDLARRPLQALLNTSISEKDRQDLIIKKQTADAASARAKAEQSRAATSAARAADSAKTSVVRREFLRKAMGEGSPETANAKKSAAEKNNISAFKTQLSFAPPVPLRLTPAHEGKLMTGDNKKIYRYLGMGPPSVKYPDGTPRFIEVTHAEAALQNPNVKDAMQDTPGSDE